MIQGFLAAYVGATDHFMFHTERELGGGTRASSWSRAWCASPICATAT